MKAGAIILSGGKNKRMNSENKAFLNFEGASLISRTIKQLRDVFKDIIVVTNEPHLYQKLNVQVTTDIFRGHGPLGGIHAGLKTSTHQFNFVVACDMPFVNPHLAAFLIECVPGYDAAVPKIDEYYQPLYAAYAKSCLPVIERFLRQKILRVPDFYSSANVRYVCEEQIKRFADVRKVFFNVNTPRDWSRARSLV